MWENVKLGDVARVIAGQSPSGENYNKEGIGTPFMQGKKIMVINFQTLQLCGQQVSLN